MDNDSKLLFSYIPLATIVFLTAMLVYQHQHNKVVDDLRSQLKTAKTEAASAPVANTTEVNSTPDVAPVNPPEVAQPQEANAQPRDGQQNPQATGMTNNPSERIQNIDKEVSTLQARMSSLQRDLQSIDERAAAFQKQAFSDTSQQRADIDQRIAAVTQSLNQVDYKLKTMMEDANTAPPEIPLRNLRSQRVELQNQLAQLSAQKSQATSGGTQVDAQASAQIVAEKDRVRRDQDDLRLQINKLQTERVDLVKKQNDTRTLQAQ